MRIAARTVIPGVLLVAVVTGGVMALLFFWNQLLKPDDLGAASLPVVAFVAGVAATFNPCGLPALPGFLTLAGGSDEGVGVRRRSGLCLAAGLGSLSLVMVLGIIVAFAGAGTKGVIAPYFRWVQLAVGLLLIGLAGLHLIGQTERLPLVGRIMALGSRAWEESMGGRPTVRSSYLFGVGFVAVGAG